MTGLDPQQRHDAPAPTLATRKKRKWPWILCGILGSLVVLGAIANAVDPAPRPQQVATSPAPVAAPSAAAPSPSPGLSVAAGPPAPMLSGLPDWIKICTISGGSSTFYLKISSAAAHNFTECGTPPSFYSGTIDDLFKLPGMDRRCMTNNADVAQEQADIGVYSDTKRANLAAAKAFCSSKGWSNE